MNLAALLSPVLAVAPVLAQMVPPPVAGGLAASSLSSFLGSAVGGYLYRQLRGKADARDELAAALDDHKRACEARASAHVHPKRVEPPEP